MQRDSLITQTTDTIPVADSTLRQVQDNGLKEPVFYSAEDSIRFEADSKLIFLYGNAKITYEQMELTADQISMDYSQNLVVAEGRLDSTGKLIGTPVAKMEGDVFEAEYIKYNIKSEKGIVRNIITQEGEGIIRGETVKRSPDAIYIKNGTYSTCNQKHPHFFIAARRLKVIPNDKVVTGPFHMVISDIPLPLGLPFGYFPVMDRSKSGIIMPTFGEQRDRGFFINNGGYYWAMNNYVHHKVVVDFYTNGSYRVGLGSNYIKRYGFNGQVNFNLSKTRQGFDDVSINPFQQTFQFGWQHRTQSKRNSNFSADVNVASSTYYQNNSYNPTNYQSSTFNSNVSYYKMFARSPFSLGVVARQDQNNVTKEMNVTLPEVTLSMNRIYPFKKKVGSGSSWYEKINVAYNVNTKYFVNNRIPFDDLSGDTILPFSQANLETILSNGKYGAKHTIPVSTSLKLLKHFSLNPTFNYEEYWYPERNDYVYDASTNSVQKTGTSSGFYRSSAFNVSTNLTTRIYGTLPFKGKNLKGIRHTLIPTLNYSYRPDFSQASFNSYQRFNELPNSNGDPTAVSYYNGFVYGGPSAGAVNGLGIAFQNNFEAKVRNKKDTLEKVTYKKVKLLENLGLTTSYNFAAESYQMANIQLVARTRLFDKLDLNFVSNFDPYTYRDSIRNGDKVFYRIEEYAIGNNQGLANLLTYTISASTSIKAKQGLSAKPNPENQYNWDEWNYVNTHPERYVDFNVPWSLFLSYNVNYNKLATGTVSNFTQTFTFNGDLSLTPKWKLNFTSGYDFVNKGPGYTTIGIIRDLHCWQMSFNVVPFGQRQSYFFTLSAKSTLLQDLKLNKRSPAFFGGF